MLQCGTPESEIDEIVDGLRQEPDKSISPKYFYDERGSQLFDRNHTPARVLPDGNTELGIMQDHIGRRDGQRWSAEQASLIEFGSPAPA